MTIDNATVDIKKRDLD